ncbi:MAG: hypothetical protein E5W38_24645, partial [Mesorhizobium sp.]
MIEQFGSLDGRRAFVDRDRGCGEVIGLVQQQGYLEQPVLAEVRAGRRTPGILGEERTGPGLAPDREATHDQRADGEAGAEPGKDAQVRTGLQVVVASWLYREGKGRQDLGRGQD